MFFSFQIRNFCEKYYTDRRIKGPVECFKQETCIQILSDLFKTIKIPPKRVLIAGCGSGEDYLIANKKLVGFDISKKAIKKAKLYIRKDSA